MAPVSPGSWKTGRMANDPGWYPDPWQPARRRWWDGTAWTDHTWDPNMPSATPLSPQPVVWMRPPDPLRDLADERSGAIWAKRGFIALFIAKIASGLITALVLQTVVDDVQRATDSGTNDQ